MRQATTRHGDGKKQSDSRFILKLELTEILKDRYGVRGRKKYRFVINFNSSELEKFPHWLEWNTLGK